MKLFSGLFAKPPPPPPPTPVERVASLQNAPAEAVVSTALGADDSSVRVGAIRLLPDGDALRTLAGLLDPPQGVATSAPPAVRHAAQERLAQLIDEGSVDFEALCSRREGLFASITVAALCKDADRAGQVLARIDDPTVLAKLAVEGPSSRVRQSAAAAIDDPAQLHELLPRVRGKDKSVYRLIKQKCDALIAERRKAEEAAREAEALCASLERHGTRAHDSLYAATLEALTARWRALPARPDPEVEQRGEQAIERCREVIAAHERDVARQLPHAPPSARRSSEAREARERELEVERQAAAERAEARGARTGRGGRGSRGRRTRPGRAAGRGNAGPARDRQPDPPLGRRAAPRQYAQGGPVSQGIEDALQAAPTVPPHLTRNLQQLDERLNELRQWKDYVVAPKRIELIEEMEALVGSDEEPDALAEHIRALQQEWRTINKGIASDASAETERFQQAFQAAFKPCQEYFAAQAAVRRENLEARKQVLERLKAFEATQEAEQADFALIAQVLREAPREWRSHSPVDREASRPAEIEFHQAMDRLRKHPERLVRTQRGGQAGPSSRRRSTCRRWRTRPRPSRA